MQTTPVSPRPVREPPTAPREGELERYRNAQRLAYACAEAVASSLVPGTTERDAADQMRSWLAARGVREWFHRPFAWFGERTAFADVTLPHHFFPTRRPIERGMPFILDLAPVVDGNAVDIGYAGCLGDNAAHARMLADLGAHRALILDGVRARRSLRAIYRDVDALLARQGHTSAHRRYPFRVLAHRIDTLRGGGAERTVGGFGLRGLRALARNSLEGLRSGWSPLWGPYAISDHPPTPGLWSVEPHLASGGIGVKFEELLVVTERDAYWLDDDLPHVRRFRNTG